jgi:hypothetical protein
MRKVSAMRGRQRAKKRSRAARASVATTTGRARRTEELRAGHACFDAVMKAAERSGLLKDKSSRIAGRVSTALVKQAKKRTGIQADTNLIEFALANIALEDNFAETFRDARGTVDAELKLGF